MLFSGCQQCFPRSHTGWVQSQSQSGPLDGLHASYPRPKGQHISMYYPPQIQSKAFGAGGK